MSDEGLRSALDDAWAILARGALDRRAPSHIVQLATNRAGGAPGLRALVLRGVDANARTIRLHTDRRSPKVAEIAADPRVCVHVYDRELRRQLRADGIAEMLTSGPAWEAAWASTWPTSRAAYQMATDYGAPLPHPDAVAYDAESTGGGAGNFAVIRIALHRIERLDLSHDGNQRTVFDWNGQEWVGRWVAP